MASAARRETRGGADRARGARAPGQRRRQHLAQLQSGQERSPRGSGGKGPVGRRSRRRIPHRHRDPARLDDRRRMALRQARPAALRFRPAAQAGSRDHRAFLSRRPGQGAAQGFAPRTQFGRQRQGFFQRPALHAGRRRKNLVRPGRIPPWLRAVHDDRARPCRQAARGDRGRREPETHLGRDQRHPRRRQGLRLCGRWQRAAHRPSRLEPRAARHGFFATSAGEAGARRQRPGGAGRLRDPGAQRRRGRDRDRFRRRQGPHGLRGRAEAALDRLRAAAARPRRWRPSPRPCSRPWPCWASACFSP